MYSHRYLAKIPTATDRSDEQKCEVSDVREFGSAQ